MKTTMVNPAIVGTNAVTTTEKKRRGTVDSSPQSLNTAYTSAPTTNEVITYDEVDIAAISGQGHYQRILLFCTTLAGFVLTSYTNAIDVLAPPTSHWCKRLPDFEDVTSAVWKNMSIPVNEKGGYDSCHRYDPVEPTDAANRTTVPCEDWEFDLDEGAPNIVSEWRLVCGRKWLLAFSRVTYMLAAMVAVPISGRVSDAVGRKPVVCFSTVAVIVGVYAGCFARTFSFFVVNRMIVSAATSVTIITLFVLLFEVNTPAYRAYYSALVHVGLTLGFSTVSILSSFPLNYQIVQMMFTIPASLLVVALFVAEESPRWLVATWDVPRASQVMVWIARVNGKEADPEPFLAVVKRCDRAGSDGRSPPFHQLIQCGKLRRRLMILCCCRFSIAFTLTRLIIGERTLHYPWLKVMEVSLRVPAAVVTCVAVNTYGRNTVFQTAFLLTSVGALSMALSGMTEDAILRAALSVLTKTTDAAALLTFYIYSMELFPTVIRDFSFCVTYAFSRIGGAVAPFLTDLAEQTHVSMPFVLISGVCLVSYHFVQYLPETMSASLMDAVEEVDQDFRKKLFSLTPALGEKRHKRHRKASKRHSCCKYHRRRHSLSSRANSGQKQEDVHSNDSLPAHNV